MKKNIVQNVHGKNLKRRSTTTNRNRHSLSIVKKMEVQEGYLLVIFDPDSASQYRTFVIGKSANIIYKSTEETANVVIYDDKLMFIKQQM